ncbi:hypothetical protein J8I29_19245 [Labrys sp. LIt4]|uniref:hypothetical protein n=1 Tax=Labrys sp. LIt4 TaxID=2821355 RepID=UPI001AE004E5|nr:hypothetical protein [Labrys sp. LIt4]MBP0581473.1 hypothetical protein [Labrys sp. LIt4]
MQAFFVAILTAVLTLAGGTVLRWWQYGRDAWNDRVNRVCALIDDYVAKSSEYWLLDLPIDTQQTPRPVERLRAEAELIGLGLQLEGLIQTLCSRFSSENQIKIWSRFTRLEEAIQGGDFQTVKVKFEPDRVRQVHSAGAQLIVIIRSSVDDALTVKAAASNFRDALAGHCRKSASFLSKSTSQLRLPWKK